MITCKRCGTAYPDDAVFCNRCNADLDSTGAANLYDQEEVLAQQRARQRGRNATSVTLLMLCLFFPFLVYFNLVYVANTSFQKLFVIVVIELLAVLALAGVKRNWRRSRLLCRILGGLLLPLFPAGSVFALILFYQLFRRDW